MIFVESFRIAKEVYEMTQNYLERNLEIKREIFTYNNALHFLPEIIWQPASKIFSGHIFPILEATSDVESSKIFAELGFYKYAQIALRNALELGVLSIYWDKEDKAHIDIQKWLNNKLASIEVVELNTEQKAESFHIINLITSWAIEESYLKVEDLNDFY